MDNQRGEDLSALLDSLGLVIANEGSTPTFTRGAGSTVDVTAMSEQLASRFGNLTVMDGVFNYSDHHYIQFSVDVSRNSNQPFSPKGVGGWNTSGGIDIDNLHCGLMVAKW